MRPAQAARPDLATLHAFSDSTPMARAIARRIGTRCAQIRVHRFPDGESLVSVRPTAPDALQRLRAAGIRTIVTTDTIAHPTNAISCAPLIAAALGCPRSLDPSIPRSLDPSIP